MKEYILVALQYIIIQLFQLVGIRVKLIHCKSIIIGSDFNETSNTIHSVHAEIDCISKIQYMDIRWDKVKVFVYREMLDGSIGMARPCPACMAYIKDMGIRNIYYTTNNGFAHEVITN